MQIENRISLVFFPIIGERFRFVVPAAAQGRQDCLLVPIGVDFPNSTARSNGREDGGLPSVQLSNRTFFFSLDPL